MYLYDYHEEQRLYHADSIHVHIIYMIEMNSFTTYDI